MKNIFRFFATAQSQFVDFCHTAADLFLVKRRAQIITVFSISGLVTLFVFASLTSVQSTRKKWTTSRPIVVATIDLPAGTALSDTNTETVSLPLAIISSDTFTEVPTEAVTRIAVRARTPLTSSIVDTSSPALDIPDGWRIVALPSSLTTPPLHIGDAVDVVGGASIIARAAIVHSVDPVTIAVQGDVVAEVAAASRLGEISLVVSR